MKGKSGRERVKGKSGRESEREEWERVKGKSGRERVKKEGVGDFFVSFPVQIIKNNWLTSKNTVYITIHTKAFAPFFLLKANHDQLVLVLYRTFLIWSVLRSNFLRCFFSEL